MNVQFAQCKVKAMKERVILFNYVPKSMKLRQRYRLRLVD